jgi:hypothetical protein
LGRTIIDKGVSKLAKRVMLEKNGDRLAMTFSFQKIFFQLFAWLQMLLQKDGIIPIQEIN